MSLDATHLSSVVSAGIIVVDHVTAPLERFPKSGELLLTQDCQLRIGGCAANVAINLAKLNVPSRVVGCIGADLFGKFAQQALSNGGVAEQNLSIAAEVPTSQTLVINVENEDRRFIHLMGANALFSAKQLKWVPGVTRVLYVGGLFLMDALDAGELAAQFQRARKDGVITVLDVVTPGPRAFVEALRKVLPFTDYFFPNEDEARVMTGFDDTAKQAACFQELGAGTVVITRGARGCTVRSQGTTMEWGAFPAKLVDATGGGDAFTAGFISGLIENVDLHCCLERASALGASCVESMGATEGVFDRAALDDFLSTNRLFVERSSSRDVSGAG